jgi:hypothetical protein
MDYHFGCFRSTSATVLDWHYEAPHTTSATSTLMKCNYCPFSSRINLEMQDHFRIEHAKRFRSDKPEARIQCPLCPWEDKLKLRYKRHLEACEKKYIPEKNLALGAPDWEPAGVNPVPVVQPPLPVRGGAGASAAASPAMSRNSSTSSLSSVVGGVGGVNASRNVNSYQFHPLVPKEHVKAANTIIAASARPVRPARSSFTPPVNANRECSNFQQSLGGNQFAFSFALQRLE